MMKRNSTDTRLGNGTLFGMLLLLLAACSYTDWSVPQPGSAGVTGLSEAPNGGDGAAHAAGLMDQPTSAPADSALPSGGALGLVPPDAGASGFVAQSAGAAGFVGGGGDSAGGLELGPTRPESAGTGAVANEAGGPGDGGCDLSAEFDVPEPVLFDGYRDRTDGRLSSDEKTIYFTAAGDIWVGTRANRSERFEEHELLSDPNIDEMTPSLTRDGLALFYGVLHDSNVFPLVAQPEGIYVSKRNSLLDTFSAGTRLSELPDGAGAAFISPSGQSLYFTVDNDIYQATRTDSGFTKIMKLRAIDGGGTFSYEMLSNVSDDELTIYFASMRDSTNYDIWRATRSVRTSDFSNPLTVAALSSPTNDFPNWLSPDGCRIYLHRYADTDWNHPQIMVASKPPRE